MTHGKEGAGNGDDESYEPLPRPDDAFTLLFTELEAIKSAFYGGLIDEDEYSTQNEAALARWAAIPPSHLDRMESHYRPMIGIGDDVGYGEPETNHPRWNYPGSQNPETD